MVADIFGRGSRLFPEIRVRFRTADRSSEIVLVPVFQVAGALALIANVVLFAYLGIGRFGHDRLVADMEAEAVRSETANTNLQDEASHLRDELAMAANQRDEADTRLSVLAGQADSLRGLLAAAEAKLRALDDQRGRLSQRGEMQQQPTIAEDAGARSGQIGGLTHALEQTQHELRQVEAQRAMLAARLAKIEADRVGQRGRSGQPRTDIAASAKKLQQLSAERDKAVSERNRLRARIVELEQKHSRLDIPWLQPPVAVARLAGLIAPEATPTEVDQPAPELLITDAPPDAERDTGGVAELSRRAVNEFERVLASTGLDIRRLFPQLSQNRAEGGPFVPPPKGGPPDGISSGKLEVMRSLIKSLPLSTPLDHYQLESGFGLRRDPFNRRLAFHTGLDLSAPYMSPVYATAPGIVSYAGYRADYGKVVEIDNGNGIATVYAHMHRYIVSVGQRVDEHAQIGFLGSTGRSSGPHMHYEIRVNGEPQDPEKFIGLARLIPVSDK